jgi:hypothetical protein
MRKVPITLSLPEDLVNDLHVYVSNRQISRFIAELVQKGIQEKKEILAREFEEAAKDEERNKEIELWDKFMGDGLDETNAY